MNIFDWKKLHESKNHNRTQNSLIDQCSQAPRVHYFISDTDSELLSVVMGVGWGRGVIKVNFSDGMKNAIDPF